jgi:DNA-binding response OmpR family regulator
MRPSKMVTVVHPSSKARIALRRILETHGCAVATDHSCDDLLTGQSTVTPDLILLDRSLLSDEGVNVLHRLNNKWTDAEIVFLPEDVSSSTFAARLLPIIDRLLKMRTDGELLST